MSEILLFFNNTISSFADGFAIAWSLNNIMLVLLGCVLGTMIGMLPGIGPVNAIAILFPVLLQFNVSVESALIFLAGIFYGSQYGNSISSILINVPGTSAAAVTCIDGHAMAKNGRAGPALAMSAISSFIGGTLSIFLLILLAPILSELAIDFGPAEYFVLMIFAFTALTSFSEGSMVKAVFSAFIGLALSTIGIDELTGVVRFTFGNSELYDGIDFIVVVIGLFAVSEILGILIEPVKTKTKQVININNVFITLGEFKSAIAGILRSCGLGFLVGVLPGAGATIASFLSYNVEKRFAGSSGNFGKGDIRGVSAPESANNSSAVGSFIPLLVLGVPGSETTAVMLAGLITLGVQPGPTMLVDNPTIFWGVSASMFLGNLFLLLINIPLVGVFAKILKAPNWFLMPTVAVLSIVGVYVINGSDFDLIMMIVFGILGYIMKRTGFPLAPMILGLVLGSLIELNFRRALLYSSGEYSTFFESPISIVLWLLTITSLFAPWIYSKIKKSFIRK